MDPLVYGGVKAGEVGISIIAMILQKQAMDAARADAKALDYRNFAYQQGRDRFSDKMAKEALKLSKDQNALSRERFGLEKMTTGYGINKDIMSRATELLNSNNSLKDRVLRNWSL